MASRSPPTDRWSVDHEDYLDRMGTDTVGRYDATPLFADAGTFAELRADRLARVPNTPTAVADIDALGFVPGGPLAIEVDVGVVAVREGRKLPSPREELL